VWLSVLHNVTLKTSDRRMIILKISEVTDINISVFWDVRMCNLFLYVCHI